jgi:hypothetical protein
MRGPDQIALPLDWPQGNRERRFIVSAANRDAVEHLRRWSMWPVKATILTGPRRSGRSLLAQGFVERVGGRLFDDAERHDEEALFHAWNAAQDCGRPLIMVAADSEPWEVTLPDLRTRLAVTPRTVIGQPDDTLFEKLIELHFADRGLAVPAEAQRYIAARVHRDYVTAERVVEAVDRFVIAGRQRLSVPTVRRALELAGLIDARGAA